MEYGTARSSSRSAADNEKRADDDQCYFDHTRRLTARHIKSHPKRMRAEESAQAGALTESFDCEICQQRPSCAFANCAFLATCSATVRPGLRAAIQADTLSLTAFEVGLFAWMALMTRLPFHHALRPLEPAYWFLMQIGMMIGFATSYPANWFLVAKGIKEPM